MSGIMRTSTVKYKYNIEKVTDLTESLNCNMQKYNPTVSSESQNCASLCSFHFYNLSNCPKHSLVDNLACTTQLPAGFHSQHFIYSPA